MRARVPRSAAYTAGRPLYAEVLAKGGSTGPEFAEIDRAAMDSEAADLVEKEYRAAHKR